MQKQKPIYIPTWVNQVNEIITYKKTYNILREERNMIYNWFQFPEEEERYQQINTKCTNAYMKYRKYRDRLPENLKELVEKGLYI